MMWIGSGGMMAVIAYKTTIPLELKIVLFM